MPVDKYGKKSHGYGKSHKANFGGSGRGKIGKEKTLTGTLDGNPKGFAFFVSDLGGDDLFIPASRLNGAMHGDRVEVRLVPSNRRGSGEAEVVSVLSRGFTTVVGKYESSLKFGFVRPDNARISKDIYIPTERSMGAKSGQKVVCEIKDYPAGRSPIGAVCEILGYPDDKDVDVLSIIRSYGLRSQFPADVMKEAREKPQTVSEEEMRGRRDFRGDAVITIDGDDSKDFDDAVSLSKSGANYRLSVHIADVTHYVKAGTKLDDEASERATSVYLCDRVLPMLPVELSNGICSLNEGEDRLTLSVIMDIDNVGNIVTSEVCEGVIRSRHRMTYAQAAAVVDGDEAVREQFADVKDMLDEMYKLSQLLLLKRKKRGTIEFDLSESKIVMDENGKVVDVRRYPILKSNGMIEEFMLAANESVAEKFCKMKVPFVYRGHETPSAEKLQTLVNFLSALGITFRGDMNRPKPADFAALLSGVDDSVKAVVNRVTLRSMMKASYVPDNIGHFGLAAEFYCHFTSPIRRYPDLAIHRIIKDILHGGNPKKYTNFVSDVSKHSSEREKLAESAERDVDDLKKAEFMSGKIGEKYDGVISGVTEWGVFVELENSVEGLVRTANLPDGDYVYNRDLMRLDSSQNSYRIGDKMRIVVEGVDGSRINFLPDGL